MKFYLSTLFLIAIMMLPQAAQANFPVPSCEKIESWADGIKTIVTQRVQPGTTNPKAAIQTAERDALYSDAETAVVFGRAFSEWNPEEVKNMKVRIFECQQKAYERKDDVMGRKIAIMYSKIHKDKRGMVGATNNDKVSMKEPSCAELRPWFDMYHNNVQSILNDSRTQSFFGVSYSKWNVDDKRKAKEIVTLCARDLKGETNMKAHHAARSVMFELNRVLQNTGGGPYKAAPAGNTAPVKSGRGQ